MNLAVLYVAVPQAETMGHIGMLFLWILGRLNRNIGKVRIPSVINKLLKAPRQLELPNSSIPPPKGATFFNWSFNTKGN